MTLTRNRVETCLKTCATLIARVSRALKLLPYGLILLCTHIAGSFIIVIISITIVITIITIIINTIISIPIIIIIFSLQAIYYILTVFINLVTELFLHN